MGRILAAALLALVTSGPARALECKADLDANGAVEINDLIAAVNEALGPCGAAVATPTPPAGLCPHDFADSFRSLCFYRGPYNATCGAPDMLVDWRSDSQLVSIVVETRPPISIAASVISARRASLIGWSRDGFATIHLIDGHAELDGSGRFTITVTPPDFAVGGCDFEAYVGVPSPE